MASSNDIISYNYCTFYSLCKTILMIAGLFYLAATIHSTLYMPLLSIHSSSNTNPQLEKQDSNSPTNLSHLVFGPNINPQLEKQDSNSPTNLSHLVFGLIGSEKAMHYRKHYLKSWWLPGKTRGYLYLDKAPKGLDLFFWSEALPPYRVSQDLTKFFQEIKPRAPIMQRMNHGILEVFKEEKDKGFRWLVMGDDDSVFFIENMVDVLAKYDHTKYYYFGGHSEFIMSNYWFSFNQGFGGAGFILSYPLAKALADGMNGCLRRSAQLISADHITMTCIADFGVNLTPLKGIHQIDLHGDLSGFLSSHPKAPLLSLHHLDAVDPIFPKMDRFESVSHLMNAAIWDQTRLLQQTIGHEREKNWTISISWGYSVHLYEKRMPRWLLQIPIETFKPWAPKKVSEPPIYMFNTRRPSSSGDPCDTPHVFFFESIKKISKDVIRTIYYRSAPPPPRRLTPCFVGGNNSADSVARIYVYSPTAKRIQDDIDRCECCDIEVEKEEDAKEIIKVKYRECRVNEIIA